MVDSLQLYISVDQGTTVGSDFLVVQLFYHPYSSTTQNLKQWFGDALKVVINTAISSSQDSNTGTPGLYAEQISNGFNITATPAITDTTYSFYFSGGAPTTGIPTVNSYLRGQYRFCKVTNVTGTAPYVVTTEGRG